MKHGVKIIIGLMVVYVAVSCVFLILSPDVVPVHYNLAGEVDRMGSKYEQLLLPGFAVLFGIFWIWASKKLAKEPSEQKAMLTTCILFELLEGGLGVFFMYKAMAYSADSVEASSDSIIKLCGVFIGAILIILGCIMPKVKRNSVMGLRTVWSLSSDSVWQKSQRFGGISGIVIGSAVVVLSLFVGGMLNVCIMTILFCGWVLACIIASYFYYRQEKKHEQE